MDSACFVCGRRESRTLFQKQGRDFRRCEGCGLIRQHPVPGTVELESFYARSYEDPEGYGTILAAADEMVRATMSRRVGLIRTHSPGGRLIDVGCGTGTFLREALRAGYVVEGVDISEAAVAVARERYHLNAHVARIENFSPEGRYDIVTAFDILEHLVDPVAFVRALDRLMAPGGLLVLTNPDTGSLICRLMGRHWYMFWPDLHLVYFNRQNLTSFLARSDLDVVRMSTAQKALHLDYSLMQFKFSNPFIYRLLSPFRVVLPTALRARPV